MKKIILDVLFWVFSLFTLILSIGAFAIEGGLISGIILIVSAIIINPMLYKFICSKVKRWIVVLTFIVVFFIGVMFIPTTSNVTDDKLSDDSPTANSEFVTDTDDKSDKKKQSEDKKDEPEEKEENEFYTENVVEGDLPEVDNSIVSKLTDVGYTVEHATEIQSILNTCGITSIDIYFQTGEAEKGLNAMSCYANGSKEDKSRFTVTTEDGVPFYVGFLNEDLYDKDQGGFLMKYTDVHIPETKVDMDTYITLQGLAENAVKGCLNYPGTADFHTFSWGVGRSDDNYKIIGKVSAKNGFGVESDISFGVWFKNVNNNFIVEGVTLDGIRVR